MTGYHYTECGLDNVWLSNGYRVEDFGEHGKGVSVENERSLWHVLSSSIAMQDAPITGQEFRFLRGLLGLTQTAMGRRLGHRDHQTVLRWEKDRNRHAPVPRDADALIRAYYLESVGKPHRLTRISERLAEIAGEAGHDVSTRRVRLGRSRGDWAPEQAPKAMAMA